MTQITRTARCGAPSRAPELDLPSFANWQTVCQLGQGRWSTVYRARPRDCGDPEAAVYVLKTARSDVRDPDTAARLLQREFFVGRSVAHPNLTCILAGRVRQAPQYLVMPFLEGTSLSRRIAEGRGLDTPYALWIARQTAEAVAALHQQGWLHSDIKPANICVSRAGHATLLDLGLARPLSPTGGPSDWAVTGTLAYTAPEFFGSLPGIGPACDVYSLGITLFEMLTGRLPFATQDAPQLIAAHTHRTPPDPRASHPGISSHVVNLLKRMMAKQPARRPAVDELITLLLDLEIDTFDERSVA